MKIFTISALVIFCVVFGGEASGQKKTLILVRHAEKDASESADKNDPALSAEGLQRSQRLAERIKKYKPGAVYSTNFKRTRTTVEPLAKHRKLEIKTYDPRKQNELIDEIMKSKTKRFVVAGHSNTIPPLANLLLKKELFRNLEDSEHATIWLIRMKDGKVTKAELLDY